MLIVRKEGEVVAHEGSMFSLNIELTDWYNLKNQPDGFYRIDYAISESHALFVEWSGSDPMPPMIGITDTSKPFSTLYIPRDDFKLLDPPLDSHFILYGVRMVKEIIWKEK